MGKGIDRARPITGSEARQLAGYGYTFVGRYICGGDWKRLSTIEAEVISKAGLYIVSIFQLSNNEVSDFTYEKGQAHGKQAVSQARSLGQPKRTPVYFAVDFDADTDQDIAAVQAYFKGVKETMAGSGYYVGVYGSYGVLGKLCLPYKFQTRAWSRGKIWSDVHLYQSAIDIDLPEKKSFGPVDLVKSNGAAGGWKVKSE